LIKTADGVSNSNDFNGNIGINMLLKDKALRAIVPHLKYMEHQRLYRYKTLLSDGDFPYLKSVFYAVQCLTRPDKLLIASVKIIKDYRIVLTGMFECLGNQL
jgi:hypothetical protein